MAHSVQFDAIQPAMALMRHRFIFYRISFVAFTDIWLNTFGIFTWHLAHRFTFIGWTIHKLIFKITFAFANSFGDRALSIHTWWRAMGNTDTLCFMVGIAIVTTALLRQDALAVMAISTTVRHTLQLLRIPIVASVAVTNIRYSALTILTSFTMWLTSNSIIEVNKKNLRIAFI